MTTQKATHQCPDCDQPPYATAKGLATHRRYAHGYVSASPKVISERERKAQLPLPKPKLSPQLASRKKLNGKFPCPHCTFVAKWKGGLTHHMNAKHAHEGSTELAITQASPTKTVKPVKPNGRAHHEAEANTDRGLIPEAAVAFTAGRVEELLAHVAAQYDLPPRSFTARVIELVHAKTVWK